MAAAEPNRKPMVEHALEYVALGYPCFPICSPLMGTHQHRVNGVLTDCPPEKRGKAPMVPWKAYQDSLPTVTEVRAWWNRWPSANIGMATGALSGVIVLDCDDGEARQLALERGGLEKAPAVWTGKPGGIHFWMAYPGYEVRNFVRDIPGTDFRGSGGYVLLPPSVHRNHGAVYRWNEHTLGMKPPQAPEWLIDLLRAKEAPTAPGEPFTGDPIDADEALRGFDEGHRDDGLFRLACRFRHDDVPQAYAEILIQTAARHCRPPFDGAEAVAKVRYVYGKYPPGGVGPSVDFDGEFRPPGARRESAAPQRPGATSERRYPIQSFAELILLNEDAPGQIVEGLIWPRRVTWVFADPTSGKTLFLLALLMHVAAGRPFCGKAVTQMPVLIIEEDSPLSVISEYVVTLSDIYEFDLDHLPIWINKIQGLRIVEDEGEKIVREAINDCPERPGVVMFDACERITPSDKYNTKEMDPLTKTLQRLIGDAFTPIVIDHTNRTRPEKGKEQEFSKNPMERLFGARAKQAISDVMLYFDGTLRGGPVELIFAKFRGETPPNMTLKFDGITGFEIIDPPMMAQNENERVVIRFFNNAGSGEYAVSDVEAAVPLKRRTLERVLSVLTKRRWLTATGSTTDRRYHLNHRTGEF